MLTNINFKDIVANLHEGLYVVDRDLKIQYWNRAAEKLTGYMAEEIIGRRCADNILVHINEAGESLCRNMCSLAATMRDGRTRQAEVFLHHKSGHRVPVLIRVTPLRDDAGTIIGSVEMFSDDSPRQLMRREVTRLQHLALMDELTQLPNRRYIEAQMANSFSLLQRIEMPFGVIFFDIDHFKQFNDEYGHQVGDQALKIAADTLKHAIRAFDAIGRWGGEEFLGVFPNVTRQTLTETGNRLRRLVKHSQIHLETGSLRITLSAGGSMAAPDDNIESLVEKADAAMYISKEQGRDRLTIHGDL